MTESTADADATSGAATRRHTEVVDVHLILRRGDEVLLARRANTGYADGLWHAPSGHIEDGEDAHRGLIREAYEEIGLQLAPEQLRVALVMQHRGPGGRPRIGWFFEAVCGPGPGEVPGEPVNREPDKCSGLAWYPLSALPDAMVAYCRAGLDAYRRGERFVLHWHEDGDSIAYDGTAPRRAVALPETGTGGTGGVHHVELWVPDLAAAERSWGWLLGRLGHEPYQRWEHGRSWRRGGPRGSYVVIEQSPDLTADRHERTRPGLNHLAFHVAGGPAAPDGLEELVAEAPAYGWRLLFPERHPYAGGPGHRAAYLVDESGFEVELVVT